MFLNRTHLFIYNPVINCSEIYKIVGRSEWAVKKKHFCKFWLRFYFSTYFAYYRQDEMLKMRIDEKDE